jgi:hypothetical protein
VERRPQEVARRVAGEDSPGPIPTVRRRGEANEQDARLRIAEPGERPTPVGLVTETGDLLAGDPLAPLDEARTAPAGDDLLGQRGERRPVRHARPT